MSSEQIGIDYNYLYTNGFIGCWYLRASQLPLYNLVNSDKRRIVCSCRRRFGKTTAIMIAVLEKCLSIPELKVYYGAPQMNQGRAILTQVLDHIYVYAPDQKPKFNTQTGCYEFENGSKIYLFGAKDTSELDKCRGQEANILILDEFAHFKYRPDYILREVLLPMLHTTHGQLIISSTPSKDLTHPYFKAINDAKIKNEFFIHTIDDSVACGDITEEEKQQIIEDCGGVDSESYQREWLCNVVPPLSSLIIPEASQSTDWIVNKDEYDELVSGINYKYYHRYLAMDIGSVDYTSILFFSYIFDKDIVLFEGEVTLKNEEVTTRNIAEKIREKHRLLWNNQKIHGAVADNNNQILLRDLANTEKIYFNCVKKDSLTAMVNCARLMFQTKSIKIKYDCYYLLNCIKFGLWNDSRTEFLRSDSLGHLDGLAAMIYGLRIIDKMSNPIPIIRNDNTFYLHAHDSSNPSTRMFKEIFKL